MRPERLELAGFTSFRDRTVVEFEGADMFALVGPTGSGKSSIIDAMTFALYGSVSRYDDTRLVAPVISQGGLEAKVRFDFSVGDVRYSATRVVRRTKTGATTKEARLERRLPGAEGTEVLAGNADELGGAVGEILGLGFAEFCKCVVLPQGEFARFLHDKPRVRQDVLVGLLDLRVYDEMGQRARRRASESEHEIKVIDDRLARLAAATPANLAALDARIDCLEELRERVDDIEPRLADLAETMRRLEHEAAEAQRDIDALCGLVLPAAPAGRGVGDAGEAFAAALAAVSTAEEHEQASRTALDAVPPRAESEHLLRLHTELRSVREEAGKGAAVLAQLEARAGDAERTRDEAEAAAERTAEAYEAVLRQDLAHTLRAGIEAGDMCPVCGARVDELPASDAPEELAVAKRARAAAAEAARHAARACNDAGVSVERARSEAEQAARRAEEIGAQLADTPDEETLHGRVSARVEAEKALHEAAGILESARTARDAAEADLTAAKAGVTAAWAVFDAARDSVARLVPPPVDRDDLGAACTALAAWSQHTAGSLRESAERIRRDVERVAAARENLVTELREACADAGLTPGARPRDTCVEALTEARMQRDSISDQIEEAERLRTTRATAVEAQAVAASLGRLLGSKAFEKWLVDAALARLVAAAAGVLRRLTNGQYSLARDERGDNFTVIDHQNADEARSARTLSGGETFLASLALALALAEEIRGLAAGGSAKLESLFLDEGFGTLDSETLDVVAAAIEELGAQGTVVGLVTHVRELAERVPVRFEVEAGLDGSRVRRVDT
ncbi:MAG: SMC family ATPase [Acidimicrobiia bacterium]|nr:SMC family ATPase [Acidimicrobiia bacterium]